MNKKKKLIKKTSLASKCLALFLSIFINNANAFNICKPQEFKVAFFNGMNNEMHQAESSMEFLKYRVKEGVGRDFNGKKISYKLFYNQKKSIFDDMEEVFNQRYLAFDDGDYVFATAVVDENGDLIEKLKNLNIEDKTVVDELIENIRSIKERGELEVTNIDYNMHNKSLDEIAKTNIGLLLVGHSQGNLFMNHAYDHIINSVSKDDIRVLHIAPASKVLHGKYILSSKDLIINSIALIYGKDSILDSNIEIPFNPDDLSGHKIIETYLSSRFKALNNIINNIQSMMVDIEYFRSEDRGFFNAIITVNGGYDQTSSGINIVVKEPYGANPQNYGRYYNDMTGFKSSCESGEVSGEYEIGYNDGGSLAGREAVLTITDSKGKEIAKRDFVIGDGLSQWWLLPKVDIGRVLVQKKNDSNEYEIIFK